jgi:hypothetical protein
VSVTDTHCNDQNYPKMERVVNGLCQQNDGVVLAINGDIMTKYNGRNGKPIPVSSRDNRVKRSKDFTNTLRGLLSANPNLNIVFNVGNHELMNRYPHLVSCFLQIMTNAGNGRFHAISNLEMLTPRAMKSHEPSNGLKDFVKSYVVIYGIPFVGYCTTDVLPEGEPQNRHLYAYALSEEFFANTGVNRHRGNFARNYNSARFQGSLNTVVVMVHEGTRPFARNVWSLCSHIAGGSVIGIFGHDHNRNHAQGVVIPGMEVIQSQPFGNDVAVIQLQVRGQSMRVVSKNYF